MDRPSQGSCRGEAEGHPGTSLSHGRAAQGPSRDLPLLLSYVFMDEQSREGRKEGQHTLLLTDPSSPFITMQRAQCTSQKVTPQHAVKGFDLCWEKCNLINFCLTSHAGIFWNPA